MSTCVVVATEVHCRGVTPPDAIGEPVGVLLDLLAWGSMAERPALGKHPPEL